MRQSKTILVLHLAGQYPLAGVAWQAVHYLVGLTQLGHDVYYIEDSGASAYDPRVQSVVVNPSFNIAFLQSTMKRFDLGQKWAFWDLLNDRCHGLSRERLLRLYSEADALINLCGATRLREEHLRCKIRILIETDPAYEQIKLAKGDPLTRAFLNAHTHHFTYGENIGNPDCAVPAEPLHWKHTRPPVVMNLWECRVTPEAQKFTSVATWKNAGKDIEFNGESYTWSKHVNFLRFQELAKYSNQELELAVGNMDEQAQASFRENGWVLRDSYEKSQGLDDYQDYIYNSRGEFTVAKDLYARTKCGWFSDRSVCYLAAGKPVVTQSTGFEKFIPTGNGLFAFSNIDEAATAFASINSEYKRHAQAARGIAIAYFSAKNVLTDLMRDAGL
jgi:hypothetical protein